MGFEFLFKEVILSLEVAVDSLIRWLLNWSNRETDLVTYRKKKKCKTFNAYYPFGLLDLVTSML